ncbi:hypothetical protein Tco_0977613 [Tanacetum coccineum]|uniref:Uncharacterized protein n=1 Tax=Tanacetum coccineum TaxID=301880 RepID=A0ABQ5EKK1_9ASTR
MAQHVIPAAQLVPQYKPIGRCNNYAVLQSIPCSPECKIVGLILLDHCLSHALTATADVPAVYLQQFWRTVSKVPDIEDTIKFLLDTNIHTIEAFMNRVGYQGVIDKVNAFFTKNLAQPWQTMFKVFNRYLTTRTSGHDQTKINILQLFHAVINQTHVDYAALLCLVVLIVLPNATILLKNWHGWVPNPLHGMNSEEPMGLCNHMLGTTNQKFNIIYVYLDAMVLDLEKANDAQAKEIAGLKKRFGCSGRCIQTGEDKIVDETQGRLDDAEMFDIDDLHDDEVIVDMAVGEKQEKSAKINEREVSTSVEDSAAPTILVTTADEGVTAAKIDEITPTSAPTTVIDELTLAQTLIEIKAAKPKAVTTAATTTTTRSLGLDGCSSRAKKDQVALDEEMARNLEAQLQAELIEEEKMARKRRRSQHYFD